MLIFGKILQKMLKLVAQSPITRLKLSKPIAMNMNRILLVVVFFSLYIFEASSQSCTPASADRCEDSNVLCSLDEVNGYTCQNVDYSNPTACVGGGTDCPNGVPNNSSWWAFVTEGGIASISLTISNCSIGFGVQIGIVGACDCSEQVACNSSCSSGGTIGISGFLLPCKTYYLWIDGCNQDVCSFSLSANSGKAPKLSDFTLSRTNLNPICKGCCADFKVTPQAGGCLPNYVWTIDGSEMTTTSREQANLCFPDAGTFTVCVQAVIGNPESGSICDEKTKCMSVTVTKKQDEIAKPLTLCPYQLPFKWNCQTITAPGVYRCTFKQNGCCEFDSVIQIDVITINSGPTVYFIGCPGEVYKDTITNLFYPNCENMREIFLPKNPNSKDCDSSYFLSTYYPQFATKLEVLCDSTLSISANLRNIAPDCGLAIQNSYSIHWYKKNKINDTLGTDEMITVSDTGEYCIDLKLNMKIGETTKSCIFTSCKNTNTRTDSAANIQGPQQSLNDKNDIFTYYNGGLKDLNYKWRIEGGSIESSSTTRPVDTLKVKWNTTDTVGKICITFTTQCNQIEEYCQIVKLKKNTATYDDTNDTAFEILPNPNQGSFMINTTNSSQIRGIKIYNSNGASMKFTVNDLNSKTKEIKLSEKQTGIYYLQLNTSQGIIYKKLMITN